MQIFKTFATHNGTFHADEVVAYTIINIIYENIELIRTRDCKIYNNADIVADVGFVYNPFINRFDHHQRNCKETLFYDIPLSSAGMVYKKFGKELIQTFFPKIKQKILYKIFKEFYKKFILEIDAIDNGIAPEKQFSRYKIHTNISNIVKYMNFADVNNHEEQKLRFLEASNIVKSYIKYLLEFINRKFSTFDETMENLKHALSSKETCLDNGQIIIMDDKYPFIQECVSSYEKVNKCRGMIKFVIYPFNDTWRVRSISAGFKPRVPIVLVKWEEMEFIHNKQFLACAKSIDTIIRLAKISLTCSNKF